MALVRTIDQLGYRIVGNPGNVGMTLAAIDEPVNTCVVKLFIDVIVPSFAVFIDSTNESMSMAH